ncbi:MAG: hypothetical protein JW832_17095 [Deltaproteobacteria bacterium]|nr:hypothetical protein [Deltaproteobacteria bacterium]
MSYSQETFESYFSKMDNFQKIADKNGLALKELLIKKAGVDEELADALIAAWESKKGGSAGSPVSREALVSYMRDMGAFQKLADLQGIPLQDWLIAMCGIDQATAEALIREWEPQGPQESVSLLDFAREPQVIPGEEKPASSETAKDPRRKRADAEAEDDMVITISRGPDEPEAQRMPAVELPGLESQIDTLHSLADSLGHQEPFHAIGELKSFELKKNYLTNPVTYEMKSKAERLVSLREDQNKKVLRHEKNLIETRQELAALQENQPKLFGREAHNQKIQAVEAAVKKTEHEIASLHAKKAEQERAYREALALIEKHTEEKLLIDRQYTIDEGKFNQAKEVIISAFYWSLLDIPDDILAGSVLGHLEWYTSFFKALPEKIDLPLQGWLKAYPIAHTLTFNYPSWHEEIETIHFVIENDVKGLKDLIRHFLDAFVANLKELFLPVGQLCMLQNEAKKTEGATIQDMADKMEHDLLASFDHSVIEFSIARLGSFYIIQALAELLNFEAQVKAFFENLEHTEHFPLQNAARRDAHRKKFTELAEACAKVLKVCFEAAKEVLAPADTGAPPDAATACRKSIQADFENYFKSSDKKLNRLLQ